MQLGKHTVHALGEVVYDRKTFHTDRYIYPVGYRASRPYHSTVDPDATTNYMCSVTDGGEGPHFHVVPEDSPQNGVVADTPFRAWTSIIRAANAIRDDELSGCSSGQEYFGFTQSTIASLIQALPNAEKCEAYVWQEFEVIKGRGTKHVNRKLDGTLPASYTLMMDEGATGRTTSTKRTSKDKLDQFLENADTILSNIQSKQWEFCDCSETEYRHPESGMSSRDTQRNLCPHGYPVRSVQATSAGYGSSSDGGEVKGPRKRKRVLRVVDSDVDDEHFDQATAKGEEGDSTSADMKVGGAGDTEATGHLAEEEDNGMSDEKGLFETYADTLEYLLNEFHEALEANSSQSAPNDPHNVSTHHSDNGQPSQKLKGEEAQINSPMFTHALDQVSDPSPHLADNNSEANLQQLTPNIPDNTTPQSIITNPTTNADQLSTLNSLPLTDLQTHLATLVNESNTTTTRSITLSRILSLERLLTIQRKVQEELQDRLMAERSAEIERLMKQAREVRRFERRVGEQEERYVRWEDECEEKGEEAEERARKLKEGVGRRGRGRPRKCG
ncbi:hypothetical protein HDV00_002604 [Rhizophlyctis rosea]|nr:hypothetical protein HDV00_002604 [Rhizophlyctis rosea]